MDYYRRLIIKVLEKSLVAENDRVLIKLKKGIDLNQEEIRHLEELLDSII